MTTLVLDAAPSAVRAQDRVPALARWGVTGWDGLAVAVLLVLWAAVLLVRYDAAPLQLWDESRNVNSALEMALHGRWLTPTYAGAVDHWNTKPPLLIWAMAGWLRLGLPPLMAMRLTSWLAAAATTLSVWGVLRFACKDRVAAFVGGLLLLSSMIYIGPHAARTGDYDALESAFLFGYVLAFWQAFESGRTRWLFLAAVLMGLGVLTKGVAAILPLPGLGLYALTRPAQFWAFLKDPRTWAAAAVFALIAGGYYLSRETYDPGYLRAVADNELGGRFLKITEHHQGSWHFYLRTLIEWAEPCTLLAPLGLLCIFGPKEPQKSLALIAACAGAALLLVLSASKSKMEWYATPLAPLLSLIAGLGFAEAMRRLGAVHSLWASVARAAAVLVLVAGVAGGLWFAQVFVPAQAAPRVAAQLLYGPFLKAIRAQRRWPQATMVDGGLHNDAGFVAYNPMLKFYAELSDSRGLAVPVVHSLTGLSAAQVVGSCDPYALRALRSHYTLQPLLSTPGCELVRIAEVAIGPAASGLPVGGSADAKAR